MIARFGAFTFDSGSRVLLDDTRAVTIGPKAFDVLGLLISHAPNVVSKEAIAVAVWGDEAPSDASLAMAVAELRKALGESAEQPRFVRTVHRRGYAFSGSVERVGGPDAAAPQFWVVIGDRSLVLPAGESIAGRDPSSAIWIDRPSVSRRHARFIVNDEAAWVEDLGSLNGTTIGGRRLKGRSALRDGDAIGIGDVTLTFGSSRDATRTPTRPLGPRRDNRTTNQS